MQQRDLLLREIEKIGVVVRAIISKIRGREMEELTQDQAFIHNSAYLKEELNLEIDFLVEASMDQLKSKLTYEHGYNADNIELMADMLSELSVVSPAEDEIILQKRALDLYAWSIEMDKSFSMDRDQKISTLKGKTQS